MSRRSGKNYKGKTWIRTQLWVCGNYMDGDVYPIWQPKGKKRSRVKPTSDIQAKLNQRNAEKKLTRIVHANFTEKDLSLHLTYREGCQPEDLKNAQRILGNFLRRLKTRYTKAGIELAYVSVTERGKTTGRIHHHLILRGGLDRDEIEAVWGLGYANTRRLQFDEHGVTALTHYIAKDTKTCYRRWNRSRNLIMPEPIIQDGVISVGEQAEMAEDIDSGFIQDKLEEIYPGYVFTEASWVKNDINRGLYIHFEMRKQWWDSQHPPEDA